MINHKNVGCVSEA